MAQPGNLVFTRRRFMRSLAPADGTLGVPTVICIPGATDVLDTTVVLKGGGGGITRTETHLNPTVVLALLP